VRKKKTDKDHEYQKWLRGKKVTTITPEDGEAILHFRKNKTVEICLLYDGIRLDEVGLMAVGVKMCLDDDAFRERLVLRAHTYITKLLKERKDNG
jgi:hypothetical protein